MSWKCHTCGVEHSETPTCFGFEAPWRSIVPEAEVSARVELTPDLCVVDGSVYFIRGHIEIPIIGKSEPLAFSVWSSLSERSFEHMGERWDSPDRAADPPYFGWLCTSITVYPTSTNLKLSVQSSAPGRTPIFTVEPTDHQLAIDQRNGISIDQWHAFVHELMHQTEGSEEARDAQRGLKKWKKLFGRVFGA